MVDQRRRHGYRGLEGTLVDVRRIWRGEGNPCRNVPAGDFQAAVGRHAGEPRRDAVAESEAFEQHGGEVGELFQGAEIEARGVTVVVYVGAGPPLALTLPLSKLPLQPARYGRVVEHVEDRHG